MSAFEVLDFHSSVKNPNSHHCQKVVGCIRVVVYAAKERSGRVGSDSSLDEVRSSRVVLGERRAVVDEPVDGDQGSLLCLGLEVVPADDGEFVARFGPLKRLALLVELLELHGVLTFSNLVVGELLEMGSEVKLGHGGDEPLGRVVLVPLDGVSEVHGELVVEVVVSFTDGAEGREKSGRKECACCRKVCRQASAQAS